MSTVAYFLFAVKLLRRKQEKHVNGNYLTLLKVQILNTFCLKIKQMTRKKYPIQSPVDKVKEVHVKMCAPTCQFLNLFMHRTGLQLQQVPGQTHPFLPTCKPHVINKNNLLKLSVIKGILDTDLVGKFSVTGFIYFCSLHVDLQIFITETCCT
jgi:hypothetical protein